jgi:DNA (cytosine-5)-methyltransferase 1
VSNATFIDLFSGCGGFTLGMLRSGFECLAAVDSNPQAIATLRENLQARSPTGLPPVGFALEADLTKLTPAALAAVIRNRSVDVIVGGPPCQGFSTARQRDGSNHGSERLKDDPRRHLAKIPSDAGGQPASFESRRSDWTVATAV